MTRQLLEYLLATHRSQRDFAKEMLDNHYYELEERDEETVWISHFIKHRDIVTQLENEIPDD